MSFRGFVVIEGLWKLVEEATQDIMDARPPIWLIADDQSSRSRAIEAIHASGGRLARELQTAEAFERLDERPADGLVLLEISAFGPTTRSVLVKLDRQAEDPALPLIVSCRVGDLDSADALIEARATILLCDASLSDRVAAIEIAQIARPTIFREVDTPTEAMRLQRLADEVGRIAKALAGLVDAEPPAETLSDGLIGYRAQPARHPAAAAIVRGEDIREMIRLRRQRDRLFGVDLFADPAWDIMLDLMAARIERLRVAVSSLCIAAAVPATTALRYIKTMTDMGLLVRVPDPTDGRRIFIDLSDRAARKVLEFIGEAKRTGATLV